MMMRVSYLVKRYGREEMNQGCVVLCNGNLFRIIIKSEKIISLNFSIRI